MMRLPLFGGYAIREYSDDAATPDYFASPRRRHAAMMPLLLTLRYARFDTSALAACYAPPCAERDMLLRQYFIADAYAPCYECMPPARAAAPRTLMR